MLDINNCFVPIEVHGQFSLYYGEFCNLEKFNPTCESCRNFQSKDDCLNDGLPILGASECTSVCFASTTESTSAPSTRPTVVPTASKTILSCDDENRPYPRQMKNYKKYWNNEEVESYICCDSIINNDGKHTTNFLNITECVPYHNNNYGEINRNKYGNIILINTYCEDSENGFQYANENYECCKTEQGIKYFIPDRQFKATVYPMIILSTIAVIACTLLMVALLIPLWLHWRVKQAALNVPVSTTRATYRRLKEAAAASTYFSYNLYLVFLAFPDFILNLYLLIMYGSYANQKYSPKHNGLIINSIYDDDGRENAAFILACSTANLYLNCVVSYEMLLLLRNNNQVVTHNPPSLLKVTLQAVGVYLFSIIVFLIHFFVGQAGYSGINLFLSVFLTYVFPIGFFFYIWITIKCRNYLPSVTESTKQLVRILLFFILLYCDYYVTFATSNRHDTHEALFLYSIFTEQRVGLVLFSYCVCLLSYLASWNVLCSYWNRFCTLG